MADMELVRLGLATHAVAHGAPATEAWSIADAVLADNPGGGVRELADDVAARAMTAAWPGGDPRGVSPR